MSTSRYRTAPKPLAGATMKGKVAIFLGPTDRIAGAEVVFKIDGMYVRAEGSAPYDLAGSAARSSAHLFCISKLCKGMHRLTMIVNLPEGVRITHEATFRVR